MIEAGYRCALPTCRTVFPLDIEHIEEYSVVKRHEFANMIVLCANCHRMKGEGPRKLDRKALKQLKANLGVINQRYNDTERRILEHFVKNRDQRLVTLPATPVLYSYLIQDGLIVPDPESGYAVATDDPENDDYIIQGYELTEHGRNFIEQLRENQEMEEGQ
jgi:hypothetical protein